MYFKTKIYITKNYKNALSQFLPDNNNISHIIFTRYMRFIFAVREEKFLVTVFAINTGYGIVLKIL